MGRELQKKKNKSGIAKVRQKTKSKKKIVTNAVVAANWDKTQTLAQNYRRLGLTSKLNTPSGGVEKIPSSSNTARTPPQTTYPSSRLLLPLRSSSPNQLATTSKLPTALIPTLAKIERDPATGRILRVLDDPSTSFSTTTTTSTSTSTTNCAWKPLHDPLNDLLSPHPPTSSSHATHPHNPTEGNKTPVIRHFETLAADPAPPKVRRQSAREEEWVRRLVERHGGKEDAYKAMWRDGELNVMQQSEGDIRRRVRRWREGGGGGEVVEVG